MNFEKALQSAKQLKRIIREGWNGKGMWVVAQIPDAHSKMTLPYLYMKTVDDNLVPWLPSQSDLFSDDWVCIDQVPITSVLP